MLTCHQVSKRYFGADPVLNALDFSMEPGEMVLLTGNSGAGKSTLLKLISNLEKPSSGQIIVNGQHLNTLSGRKTSAYRAGLGMAFQSPTFFWDRSVFANVAITLEIQGHNSRTINKRVHATLDRVGLLHKTNMLPGHLSGGEQQRLGFARAVVHKPTLLLADEPTGHLDPTLSKEMMDLLVQLNQSGVGILMATHDLSLIAGMKHRILLLKGGKLW